MKRILPLFVVVFLLFSFALPVKAASLSLNQIGTAITENKTFSEWTYEGVNPQFIGETTAGSAVEIKVDDLSYDVIADVNGNWTWQPTSMPVGDYEMAIQSGSEFISFTLHLIEEDSIATASAATTTTATTSTTTAGKGGVTDTTEELPQSGAFETTILLVASGMTLIGFGILMKEKIQV